MGKSSSLFGAVASRGLFFAFCSVAAAALCACEDPEPPVCQGDACGAGGAGEVVETIQDHCPESGVLRGPWTLRFDETSAVVRWDGCAPHTTEVVVELEPSGSSLSFEGKQTTHEVQATYSLLNGIPPDLPGLYYQSEVAMTGLAPGSCYRVSLTAESRSARFCTSKPAGQGFRFLAIGDTNPSLGDVAGVLKHGLAEGVDFSIHLGDIQYYASIFESWSAWFPLMAPLLEAGAFMPSIGNHEDEIDFEFEDYYTRLFGGAGFDSSVVDYYRFQSGGVWFFSLSTEIDMGPGSVQGNWLEAQMADAAKQPGYRFGVVYFHKPMITLSEYSQNKSERLYFKPLFEQYGIKLVMQGHVHGYERFVDGNITYVVSGGGGASLYDLDVSIADRPEEAALRVAAHKRYHSVVIEAGATAIQGRAIANDGTELDSFMIPLP